MFEPTTNTLRNAKFHFSSPFTQNKNLGPTLSYSSSAGQVVQTVYDSNHTAAADATGQRSLVSESCFVTENICNRPMHPCTSSVCSQSVYCGPAASSPIGLM